MEAFDGLAREGFPKGTRGIQDPAMAIRVLIHWLFFFLFWCISYIYSFPSGLTIPGKKIP